MPTIIDINDNHKLSSTDEVELVSESLEKTTLDTSSEKATIDSSSKTTVRKSSVVGQDNRNLRGRRRHQGSNRRKTESPTPRTTVQMKNAVMMLNEMFPPPEAPQYRVISMTGPPNNPTFSMVCILQGESHEGTGKSKKEAKLAASQQALVDMFGKDFSGSDQSESRSSTNTSNPRNLNDIDSWLELEGKNPVSILNELYPGVIFQLMSVEGPSHAPQFSIRATLADVSYEGRGISKKEAKLHASKAMLVHIHKVGFDPMTGKMKTGGPVECGDEGGHSWADRVGNFVRVQFNTLFEGTTYSRRKVMAGIVVDLSGTSKVICVSSGTKCVNGEQLCLAGSTLNDCHAEVVARRCLILWLYNQLDAIIRGDMTTVFQPLDGGGFTLKPGVTFHLFISTAPCGDARIFSLHEEPNLGSNQLTKPAGRPGEGNRAKLRSKIESGMGTVPLPEEGKLQTWDGVLSGERLLTMACSDKILRWNVVGAQGALLTHLITPIYFSTITVGSKFHPDHMSRALYQRAGQMNLPKWYEVNQPPLLATTSPEVRQASKAQEYSLNWIENGSPEVVLGSTGRTTSESPSRLCKRAFADKFLNLVRLKEVRLRHTLVSRRKEVERMRYSELKQLAKDFVVAKDTLVTRLVESGAGRWVEKPVEQDQFYM